MVGVAVRIGVVTIRKKVVVAHMLGFDRIEVATRMVVVDDHKPGAGQEHIHQFCHLHRNQLERLKAIHISQGTLVQEELHSLVLILEGKLAVVQMVDHRHKWL